MYSQSVQSHKKHNGSPLSSYPCSQLKLPVIFNGKSCTGDYGCDDLSNGDIVYVEIETLNETIEMSDVFGTVEAVKTVSDLFMPIAGEIIEINDKLESEPELVNTDPYGEGWMVKIKYDDVSQLDSLLDLDGYESITK